MSLRRFAVGHGMRAAGRRTRRLCTLPNGRPIAVAVGVAVVVGGFGAALGSWTAALTTGALPDDAALADLSRRASGVTEEPDIRRESSALTGPRIYTTSTTDADWDAEQARQRYATDWSVSALTVVDDFAIVSYPGDATSTRVPSRYSRFTAQAHGVVVVVSGTALAGDAAVYLDVWAAHRPTTPALGLAGTAIGLLSGWLLTATIARRTRSSHPAHLSTVAALTVTTLLILTTPTVALYTSLGRVLRPPPDTIGPAPTVHHALVHGPYWTATPAWLLPTLTIAGGLLALITLTLGISAQDNSHREDRSA